MPGGDRPNDTRFQRTAVPKGSLLDQNPLFTFNPAGKKAPKKKRSAPPKLTMKQAEKQAKDFRFMTPQQKLEASGGFLNATSNTRAANSFLKAVEANRVARQHLADAEAEHKKAEARSKAPISIAGFDLSRMSSKNIREIGSIATNFGKDFPALFKGLGIAAGYGAASVARDAASGHGLAGALGYPTRLYLNTALALGGGAKDRQHLANVAATPYSNRHQESELNKFSRPLIKSLPASYAALASGKEWQEHPLLQFLNAMSIVAPATRAASIGALAKGARAANFIEKVDEAGNIVRTPIPRGMALKAGVVESYRPGMLRDPGIVGEGGEFAGGIKPRQITLKDAQGNTIKQVENARPISKSPWGRAGQKAFEDWSTWIGKQNASSRWAPGSRMGAHAARAAAIERARWEARIQPMVDDVITGIKEPDATGWTKIRDAFNGIVKADPGKGALIMSAIQGPERMSLSEAGNAAIAEAGARLKENTSFRQRIQDVEANKASADQISNEMDSVREAIDSGEVDPEQGKAWLDHMREEMLTFAEEATKGQEQITFDLGQDVPPVRAPAREQVLNVLTEQFGPKEAAKKIRYMDAVARSVRPDDPARWYHEVSVQRAKTAEGLDDPLFQRVLPEKAPEWSGNPYRQNRLAREAGLAEPHKPPFEMEGLPDTTSAAAQRAAGNVAKVKPQHRVFTPVDRLKRIKSKIKPSEVDELSRWYETLWDWFAYIHGEENAKKAGNAFLASQAAISPEGGVRVVRQVLDHLRENDYAPGTRVPRVAPGSPHASIHLTADNVAALLLDEHLGTNPAGVAQKLSDFFDSGFGRRVRTMMESKEGFGGPGVVDRWTMRSDGFIDSDMKRYVEANLKELGVENAEPKSDSNPGGFEYDKVGSDAVYEYSSQNLNELLKQANKGKGLYGKKDWTIDQIQALDWFATRSTFGPYVDAGLEDIGGWRGAQQGSIQTVTGVGGDVTRESVAAAVREAGADIPGNDLERYIELDPTTGTVAVSFSGSPKNAAAIATAISAMTGKPAYHLHPPGVGTATKRAPILTATGDTAAVRDALRTANEERQTAEAAADAELEARIAAAKTEKQNAALQKKLDKQRSDRVGEPMIFVRDDGIDIVFADEKAGRLGTSTPVEAEVARIQAAVQGNGTIVRDDRILEAHDGAAQGGKRGAQAERVPGAPSRGGRSSVPTLTQRVAPRELSAAERDELRGLYRERQQLKGAKEGTLDADRAAEVDKAIATLESSREGRVFGATEGVGTDKRRITLLPGARGGVGRKPKGKIGRLTFEHEMLHSTVEHLDDRGQKALSDEYAGGRPVAEWTTAQHEAVAAAYESWIRDSKSVPQVVHDAFTRMEKGGYHNSVILKDEEVNQVLALSAQIADAIRHGNHNDMSAARDALVAMSHESEDIRRWILSYNRTPEQMAKVLENDKARRNIIVDLYRERGLIDPNQEAAGYAPHFDMADMLGESKTGPTSTGMDNVVAGKVTPDSRVLSNKQNRLVRHQLGEVLQDPRVIIWQLRQRMRVMQTIQARDWLWNEMGKPIKKYSELPANEKPRDVIILRNPKKTPEKIDSITKALQNLSPERMDEIRKMRSDQGIDIEQILDELAVDDISHSPSELYYDPRTMKSKPAWLESESDLRYVPRGTAIGRLGRTFASNPTGSGSALMGTLNGLARISMIYAPGVGVRYVARNYLQNVILLATTNPSGFRHMLSGVNRDLERNYPEAAAIMKSEYGSYAGTALPEFNTRARGRMQTIEREVTRHSRRAGEGLGQYADEPLRAGAYRANAANWGYTSNADIDRLLNPKNANYDEGAHANRIRQQIRQQTRDDMIDFDALSPGEKATVARYLFIWPFVRGFAKWPAMYLREYPGRAAAASMLASSQGALDQNDKGWKESYQFQIPGGVPIVGGKQANASWLSPTGGAEDWAQSVGATLTGLSEGKASLKPLVGGRLTPQLKTLADLVTGDVPLGTGGKNALKEFVPGAKDVLQTYDTMTGKQDGGDLLLQQLGAQVSASSTGKKKAAKWANEVNSAVASYEKKHGAPIPPAAQAKVDKMVKAYSDWATFEDAKNIRALNEGRQKGLTGHERLEGMILVAGTNYPAILAQYQAAARAHGFEDLNDLADSGKDTDGRAKWVADKLYNAMFGSKSKITSAGKAAAK